jgi:ABC-type Fe3+/spermidine/putrescine transport system ATPase subunit
LTRSPSALFGLLRETHARGATIFFSSHVLSEVEELCDRVALIRDGRLAAVDRIDDLHAQMQRRVTVKFAPWHHYFPQEIVATDSIDPFGVAVLLGWLIGGVGAAVWVFARRDLAYLSSPASLIRHRDRQ